MLAEIDPDHANAAKYLTAVRAQTAHRDVSMPSRPGPAKAKAMQGFPSSQSARAPGSVSSRSIPQADTGVPQDDIQPPARPGSGMSAHTHTSSPWGNTPLNLSSERMIFFTPDCTWLTAPIDVCLHRCQRISRSLPLASPRWQPG